MRDATRNLLIAAGVLGALAIAAATMGGNRKAIAQARAESQALARQRDSLLAVVAARDTERAALTARADTFQTAANQLRDSVDVLEQERAEAQLTVREIRTVGALQTRLRRAFPELGKAGWGLTRIPTQDGDTIGIEYLMVPAWFAETFAIDRANAKSWRAQKTKLLAVDSLRVRVAALQDSVVRLTAANAQAYRAGYESAYSSYQEISKRYVAELKKPRLGVGSRLSLILAAGAGMVVGGAIRD